MIEAKHFLQMKPEVEKFFASPKDMLKQFMQVLDFQDGHRQRLIKHKMSLGASDKQSRESDITAQGFRELQREYQKLREENNRLKQALGAIPQLDTTFTSNEKSSS
ncbi:uncharacterized protein LOC135690934 [Rhopilema esculentum]|uniref:uncharacterized protein LOC135690934 n=1 Tax=Rhopilema esculentum TaxID=499914 RepID=UPI0031DB9D0A